MEPTWNTMPVLSRAASMLARPPEEGLGTEVGVHVLVVGLEEADGQMMIEPRRLIVHASAHRQIRTPRFDLMVWSIDQRPTHESVRERSNISVRKAKDDATGDGYKAVIVAMCTDWIPAHAVALVAVLVLGELRLNTDKAVEEIRATKEPTYVHGIVGIGHKGAVRIRNMHRPFGGKIAVTCKDIPPRRRVIGRPFCRWRNLSRQEPGAQATQKPRPKPDRQISKQKFACVFPPQIGECN